MLKLIVVETAASRAAKLVTTTGAPGSRLRHSFIDESPKRGQYHGTPKASVESPDLL
jgi:hypothetical protein